jgi:hypothetical protein
MGALLTKREDLGEGGDNQIVIATTAGYSSATHPDIVIKVITAAFEDRLRWLVP